MAARRQHVEFLLASTALLGTLALTAAPAAAFELVIPGDTTGGATFNRPVSGNPPTDLNAGFANAVPFQTHSFVPRVAGVFRIQTTTGTNTDTYLHLYRPSFNPASPLTNVQHGDDDGGIGLGSRILAPLVPGSNNTIVVSGFDNANFGTYTLTIAGPDTNDGEIVTAVQNVSHRIGESFFGAMLDQAGRWRTRSWGAPGAGGMASANSMRVELASAQPITGVAQAGAPGSSWPPGPRFSGPLSVWATAFGGSGNREGDLNAASAQLNYNLGGGAFGADYQVSPNFLVGGSIGVAGSGFSMSGTGQSGDARMILFGVYGSYQRGPWYIDATAGYGRGFFRTDQTRALPLNDSGGEGGGGDVIAQDTQHGQFSGNLFGGRIEAGWRFMAGGWNLTPTVGLSVVSLQQDGFTETPDASNNLVFPTNLFSQSFESKTTTSVRTFLGGEASTVYRLGDQTAIMPRLRLAWAHEFSATREVGSTFTFSPTLPFTIRAANAPRDAAVIGAGVDLSLARGTVLFVAFNGEFSGQGNFYGGTGGLRLTW